MHSFINNFFIQILKDLAKFFVNIKGMDLVRMNIKKYNQAFAKNFFLDFVLTF